MKCKIQSFDDEWKKTFHAVSCPNGGCDGPTTGEQLGSKRYGVCAGDSGGKHD